MKKNFHPIRIAAITALTVSTGASCFAQATPVGLWRTIDDAQPGKQKVLIRILEEGGVYSGRVEKVLDPALIGKVCEKCTGNLAKKPIEGLQVMTGMRKEGDMFGGGEVVDAEGGGTYRCRMVLKAEGRSLEVRGFIGIALLGRTQVWERVE